LAAELPNFILKYKASKTVKMYQSVCGKWCFGARKHGVESIPASDLNLALYLISVTQGSISPDSVNEVYYSVKWAYDLTGFSSNPFDSTWVKSVTEASHRILGHSVSKKNLYLLSINLWTSLEVKIQIKCI
jgi:hypothetical protein